MAGVRDLFDHSIVLVDDPSVCRTLARSAAVAVSHTAPRVDRNVGSDGCDYIALARPCPLSQGLVVDSGELVICSGPLHLLARRQELQRKTTQRFAGTKRE